MPTADDNFWVTAYEEVSSAADTPNYAAVVRITAGGEIDRAYGSSGYAQIKFDDTHYTRLHSCHESSDGNLIVFGGLIGLGGARFESFMITRLLPSALTDSSFGDQGVVDLRKVVKEIRTHVIDIYSVRYAVQPDGGIFILAKVMRQTGKITKAVSYVFHITKEGKADLTFHDYGFCHVT